MTKVESLPCPGAIARVRQRTYLVEQVILGGSVADSTLVRLSCVDDDNQGVPLEVLWENEIDREVLTGEAWESVAKKGFDNPKVFGSYLNTLRWNCVTSTDPKLFQSPFRAGIKLEAYQLEPLRKALLLPRVNLFIADDVGLANRDTAIVVRELFARAESSVLVVGYAIYQGKRVFESLAVKMQKLPELAVTMCLDVNHDRQDKTPSGILISKFVQRFKDHQWPHLTRLPQIYFDPRSTEENNQVRSSLHAKVIVIDRKKVFVSSANFMEAAQDRNIEVGLLIESESVAEKISAHFETLIDRHLLERAI